jgi:hypothetical protein
MTIQFAAAAERAIARPRQRQHPQANPTQDQQAIEKVLRVEQFQPEVTSQLRSSSWTGK